MNNRVSGGYLKMRGRKIALSAAAGALLLFLYLIIFSFSEQDGEQSGSLSRRISEKCVEIVNTVSGRNWTSVMKTELAVYFEHPIRKLAHFLEYACMGVLVFGIWSPWRKPGPGWCAGTVLWVFVSAAADELHQYFVPGRYNSFADVCLDTLGGAFGLLVCAALRKLWLCGREKRKRRRENRPAGK